MNPHSNLAPQEFVYFDRKTFFSASQDLATTRSKDFSLPESANQVDLWNLKPPNFTPKLYRSLKIPRSKGRNISLTCSRELVVRPVRVSTGVLPEIDQKKALQQFKTSYRPADSFKSKLMFVKTGKYPTGPYNSPKPHDFRPLDEDLPHIVTTSKRDPIGLNFKSQHLDMIYGSRHEPELHTRSTFSQINTYKQAEPRWEANLILPKLSWPPKSASYTRHRRRRGIYSAFMDRVEEKISSSWKNG
ncbi:putative uncharacterized protein C7orf78 [Osmerus mordax]|uniref:putative uncharacterized protein C7orf78 n=1 Tax=Osmerus mordax TaxID=8014 RepID=UPI00350FE456